MTLDVAPSRRKAAQYLRMSKEQQRYSIARQRELLSRYADDHGFTIVRSYEDAGRSGVTLRGREGLKALLEDVVSGDVDYSTVLVVDVSRWGRYQDHDEAAHYEFLCRRAGVQVVYCAEAFENDNSATAAIVKSLKRVMAADYSRQLSDRCQAGLRRRVLAGFAQGGPPPYGVRRQAVNADGSAGAVMNFGERRNRVDQAVRWVRGPPDEIAVIQRIFGMFLDREMGVSEIAARLNADGIAHPVSKGWTHSRVKGVLTNEIAAGVFVFNKRAGQFPNTIRIAPVDKWLRIKVFAPIISPRRFRAAADKLQARAGRRYADAELLSRLRRLLDRRGTLSCTIVDNSDITPGSRAYMKRFSSMEAAYKRIGYVAPKTCGHRLQRSAYERSAVILGLKRLYDEQGFLSIASIDADGRLPNARFVRRLFGTVEQAYANAEFHQTLAERHKAGLARAFGRRS